MERRSTTSNVYQGLYQVDLCEFLKGVISKKGKIFGQWKDYLFVAGSGHLRYFSMTGNQKKMKGDIVIDQCTLEHFKSSSGYIYPNSFVITSPSRSYYLCCPSYNEFNDWKGVLLSNGIKTIDIVPPIEWNSNGTNENSNNATGLSGQRKPMNAGQVRRTMSTAVKFALPVDPDIGYFNLLPREILLEVLIQLDQFTHIMLMTTCKFFYTYLRPMLSEDLILFVLQREKKRLEIQKKWRESPTETKQATAPNHKPAEISNGWQHSGTGRINYTATVPQLLVPTTQTSNVVVPQNMNISSPPHNTSHSNINTCIPPPNNHIVPKNVRRNASASVSYPKKATQDIVPVPRSKSFFTTSDNAKLEYIKDEFQVEEPLTITSLCTLDDEIIVSGHHNGMIAMWLFNLAKGVFILKHKVWADPCPVSCIIYFPAQSQLMSISKQGHKVFFWNLSCSLMQFSEQCMTVRGPDLASCICLWNTTPVVGFRNGSIVTYTVTPNNILEKEKPVWSLQPACRQLYPTCMVYFAKKDQLWVGTNLGMVFVFPTGALGPSMEFSAYDDHPVTSLCCWYSQIACASNVNTLVKILNSKGTCCNTIDCSNVALDTNTHTIVSKPNCKSGVILLIESDSKLWTVTRSGLTRWNWAGHKPEQVLQHGPISSATDYPSRVLFAIGRKCSYLNQSGHSSLSMLHQPGENFDHPWKLLRLLWVGHLKNSPENCLLAVLPAEVISMIYSFCKGLAYREPEMSLSQ